ncbi:hypothetical protein NLU13_7147 [Sarocladium strictum]|uniref:Cell cycle control protein n=1 Tax=Sarocladium strictum TaxID=5046 RepID=A0AA39GEQ9_SARSR|nr:hypothetical protein NLU13_7147 [Sarocladium strictum]
MATTNTSNGAGADDDPIVLPDSPPIDRRSINFLLNEPLNAEHRASRAGRLRQRRVPPPQVNTQPPPDVIDLTEEPDSPIERSLAAADTPASRPLPWPEVGSSRHRRADGSRNPRRTNSTRISPPMLTRSDSTLMSGRHSIIDLTDDSPEESRTLQLPRISRQSNANTTLPSFTGNRPLLTHLHSRHHHRHHHHHHHQHPAVHPPQRQPTTDEIVEVVTAVGTVGDFVQNSLRHYHGFITGGFSGLARAFNPPQLDVTRNAYAPREETPQPPMDPVPPVRPGFTRDTHAESDSGGEDTIAVCPACNDELAYDPTEVAAAQKPASSASSAAGAAGRKRKRAPGEHHFWALKKCGHVYCADCFENRKPSKANPAGVGFRLPSDKTGNTAFQEMRCAVEGCETKVAQKGEWIGIFL